MDCGIPHIPKEVRSTRMTMLKSWLSRKVPPSGVTGLGTRVRSGSAKSAPSPSPQFISGVPSSMNTVTTMPTIMMVPWMKSVMVVAK